MLGENKRSFEFGKNWLDFIEKNFDEERVDIAKSHILGFMQRQDLTGLTVLDIGCGSGLHSLAMFNAGAARVQSFDYDPISVKATQFLHAKFGKPENWIVEQGSVLDTAYIADLPIADLVYSWGVLHHTGDVWCAIRNAARRVNPNGGLFYIALYSADVQVDPTPDFWLDVKIRYVASGWLRRRLMEFWYIWRFQMQYNPVNIIRLLANVAHYKKNRGMNFMTDIRDWLGGWPMQFVYDSEAISFVEALGFRLVNIATGQANTEFLFVKDEIKAD